MYIYKISVSNYDEFSSFELVHNKKFSKEELHSIVSKSIKKVINKKNIKEKSFINSVGFLFFDYDLLCELHKFGFRNLIYENSIEFDDVDINESEFPISKPQTFDFDELDECEKCSKSGKACAVKNKKLNILCTEHGVIVENME